MAVEIIVTPYAEVDLKDALAYYNEVSESNSSRLSYFPEN